MEPQFHDGDRVLVQYCAELSYGDIGIFYVPRMGGVIKQIAHDRLHSLNPAYDDIFPYEDGAKIIGRVLGKVTEEMIPDQEEALYMEAQEYCQELCANTTASLMKLVRRRPNRPRACSACLPVSGPPVVRQGWRSHLRSP